MKPRRYHNLLFVLPYLAFFCVFLAYPVVHAFSLAFYRWDLITPPEYVGLKNFVFLAHDASFHQSILNTLKFILLHIPAQMVVALFLALVLHQKIRFKSFFRAAFFMPVIVSGAAVTILWSELYQTDGGLINKSLQSLAGINIPWLTHPSWTMPAIAIMATWKNVGFYVVLYLAGLQNVSESLYEAASIDGASALQKFWYITIPHLKSVTILVCTLSTISGFQLFIEPYVLTGGGPMGSSMSVVLYMYKNAYMFQSMGYAATIGLALGGMILIVVFLQRRILGAGGVE